MKKILGKITSVTLLIALVVFMSGFAFVPRAMAGSLTSISDTMSRQKASTSSDHTIRFRLSASGALTSNGNTVVITFPSDFNFTAANITDVTFTHGTTTGAENTETLAASPSATEWGAAFSGTQNRVFTLTAPTDGVGSANFANSDYAIITIDDSSNSYTNPTTTGSKTITIVTTNDSGSLAIPIVAGSAADENVVVTATVDPTITFTNDDVAIGFGTLTTSNARFATADATGTGSDTTAHTLTVGTNAPSGYTLTYNGATLTGTPSGTITALTAGITDDADGTPGSSQFGISGALTGSGSMASGYDNSGTADWKFVASTTTTLASYSSPTSDSIAMHYLANIASTTPAGSYTTTITYIATGNF